MKIVTVINDTSNKIFNLLRTSCALNGLELVTLVSKESDFYSLRLKDQFLQTYLSDVDDNELIFFTDGTDVVFLASENEILDKFYKFNTDLLFSPDLNCWPDKSMASFYDQNTNSPFMYLNSGGFIGKAGLIKQMLEENDNEDENYSYSNQYVWSKCYLKNKHRMKLDTNCEIFCTFYNDIGNEYISSDLDKVYELKNRWFEDNFSIENYRIYNKITNTYPCQAHFNGYSKLLLDERVFNMVYSAIPNYKEAEFYHEM